MVQKAQFSVGETVHVHGTGRRWTGATYSAVVMDVRTEDNTAKLRFADGGYKRYDMDTLTGLMTGEAKYAMEAYEMNSDDHYDPTAEALDPLEGLRAEIREAVKRADFEEAQRLHDKIATIVVSSEKLQKLQHNLVYSVQKERFREAGKIQQEIDELKAAISPTEGKNSKQPNQTGSVFQKAMKRALGGGIAGAMAMVTQVCSLMWMRTTMNYQYRYGTTTKEAWAALYKEGGIPRFYRGIGPALFQGPLSRFGDTAANTGVLALMNSDPSLTTLPTAVKTVCASAAAASWRIFLMPIDTVKTTMQVEGKDGMAKLKTKFAARGPIIFWHGALAASGATFAGHYPWFFTYNMLSEHLPVPDSTLGQLGRNAVMGFSASFISDTVSNSLRVVKTYRQTNEVAVTYPQAVKEIVAADGYAGLFGRGLQTRILANGMQGIMFSITWKFFEKKLNSA